ncbi:carbohydrate-binding protein [Puniceicoccaceae bacterium K14]|nr:carbohydrate-binding protein [Puniceicoccaceae bacterium K14]
MIYISSFLKTFSFAALIGAASTTSLLGVDFVWNNAGGDNDFTNADNWDGGVVPVGTGNFAHVNETGEDRVIVSDGSNQNLSAISIGIGGEGEMEVTGGAFVATSNSNHISRIGEAGGSGTLNQSGGTVTINALYMGFQADSVGIYNLTGGDCVIARGQNGASLFVGNIGEGTFEISGGSLLTRSVLQLAPNNGTGVFSVVGSAATEIGIGSQGSVDGGWIQGGNGTLKVAIDDGGLTKIFVDDIDDGTVGGNVTFESGALLDVEYIGSGDLTDGSWVVMEWEGSLEDFGLTLDANDAILGWSFAFEDRGVNGDVEGPDTLVLNYEPLVDGEHLIKQDGETLDVSIAFGDTDVITVDGTEGVGSVVGNAIFAEGAILDVSYTGELVEGSWTIFDWQGTLSDNGLALSPEDEEEGWKISYEDNGVNSEGLDTLVLSFSEPEILSTNRKFQHPGLMHNKTDLDRVKFNIQAGIEPWATQFSSLAADEFSSYDYSVQGNESITYLNRENPPVNRNQFQNDFTAAYQNALMWYFTEDQRHADKAIEILNTWNNLTHVDGIPLGSGIYGWGMLQSAEIIKSTNAGWKEEDIQKFKDMLVYPGYSTTEPATGEVTFYWKCYVGDRNRAGNQDMSCYMTLMAIGIFMDNEIIYDRGLRYLKGLPHRADDLPYPSGPSRRVALTEETPYQQIFSNEQLNTIEDYGFDGVLTNYILPSGQCMETARDQSHSILGMGFLSRASEMAWVQGDDLYGFADNRLLAGWEYHCRYNASFLKSYPDQLTPWEPTVESGEYEIMPTRTGRSIGLAPNPWVATDLTRQSRGGALIDRHYMEMPLNHYMVRANLDPEEYKWLERARDLDREERGDFETRSTGNLAIPSYGTAMFTRFEGMAGEPIGGFDGDFPLLETPFLPGKVEAENYDYYQQEAGGGEGLTYHDSDDVNSGGEYRLNNGVDIEVCSEGGFNLTELEDGEWLTYTVHVPVSGTYAVSVRYASASGGGAIRFAFNGSDVTGDVSLPATGSDDTWATHTVAEDVSIGKGVQAMRVYVSGSSSAYDLNSMTVELLESELTTRVQAEDFETERGTSLAESTDEGEGDMIESAQAGSWSQYNSLFLGTGSKLKFRVARADGTPSGRIDVRLGSQSGELVGSVDVPVTGGWDQWETIETFLNATEGGSTIYLVYEQNDNSPRAGMFNLNWFELDFLDAADGLVVESLSESQTAISWGVVEGATGYSLKRSESSGGPYEEIAVLNSVGTSFVDTNLEEGVRYYYVVNTVFNDLEGAASEELLVIPSGELDQDEASIYLLRNKEDNNVVVVIPNTELGHFYRLQAADSLEGSIWEYLGEALEGTGGELNIVLPFESFDPSMFYQLEVSR